MIKGFRKGIIFRDRPLKEGEKYHHICQECGEEIHPDMIDTHQCSKLLINLKKYWNK